MERKREGKEEKGRKKEKIKERTEKNFRGGEKKSNFSNNILP